MLSKILSSFLIIFVLTIFLVMSVSMISLLGQWFRLNSLATYLADSQAKFGGHTTQAEAVLDNFVGDSTLQNFQVTVTTNPSWAAPHGQTVGATVNADFPFQIGQLLNISLVRISAEGRSISTYRGLYNVTFVSPSP